MQHVRPYTGKQGSVFPQEQRNASLNHLQSLARSTVHPAVLAGPAGATGATGATGAPGPAGPGSQFSGIQVQLIAGDGITVEDGEPVLFDTVLHSPSSNIFYDMETGEFQITSPGIYFAAWWVTTEGSDGSDQIAFATEVNGANRIAGYGPCTPGQISGNALLPIVSVPARMALVNASGALVVFSNTAIQANLTILELAKA